MPALCSATYFFISSYVALVSADVISISSSSIVTLINHPAFVSVGTKEQPSQREQSDKIDQRSRLFPAYILPPEMPEDLLPGWSLCRKYIQYGLPHKKESSAMLWDGFHPWRIQNDHIRFLRQIIQDFKDIPCNKFTITQVIQCCILLCSFYCLFHNFHTYHFVRYGGCKLGDRSGSAVRSNTTLSFVSPIYSRTIE